jgi:hypothetical protein
VIEDASIFQLLAVTCFYLSFKVYEKKTMTIGFVAKYLLGGKWGEEDIRKAEILVLEKIDFELHTVNIYSFYEAYKIIMHKHFSNNLVEKLDYLVMYTTKQAIMMKDLVFNLSPSELIRIILNAAFLLLSRLTGLDLGLFERFFLEITAMSDQEMPEFEKYSNVLFAGLKITEDFVEKFSRIQ